MSDSQRDKPQDKALGLDARICRRDFLNSTLIASGSLLLNPLIPQQLVDLNDEWTGPGGIGDYKDSNGNTAAVMNAGHQVRDHVFDAAPPEVIETGETIDCVVVGGGLSGLAAALSFRTLGGDGLTCLVLENHPVFGGEAKRNDLIVDGQHLLAPQGSDHFQIPYPHSFIARYYEQIGINPREFKYQTWGSSLPEMTLGRTFEQVPRPNAAFFGAK